MNSDIALDTSVAIRYLNKDRSIIKRLYPYLEVFLPTVVVGELIFGAENSARSVQNLPRYMEFIELCKVVPMGKATAILYSQTNLLLKRKGRTISPNDVWIAAQCIEQRWTLITDDSDFSRVNGLVVEQW